MLCKMTQARRDDDTGAVRTLEVSADIASALTMQGQMRLKWTWPLYANISKNRQTVETVENRLFEWLILAQVYKCKDHIANDITLLPAVFCILPLPFPRGFHNFSETRQILLFYLVNIP